MPTTRNFKRGSIVLVPFPFSDQSSSKVRPAVVLNPPYPSDDLLIAAVTSAGAALRPGEFAVQSWREAGLVHPSFVKRAIASISGNLVRKYLGAFSATDRAALDQALCLWFGLESNVRPT